MTTLIKEHITLHNIYNIHNSNQLANDITNLKITNGYRMVTFDIKDLYVNIPIKETIQITKEMLHINNDTQTTHQILSLLEIILEQNYFQFKQKINKPKQGVAMGSPISGLIAEIFLQHHEQKHVKQALDKKHVLLYTRYVNDVMVIYDSTRINTQQRAVQYNTQEHGIQSHT
jgi:hypothetical protein